MYHHQVFGSQSCGEGFSIINGQGIVLGSAAQKKLGFSHQLIHLIHKIAGR
jgi:hypothetical protein